MAVGRVIAVSKNRLGCTVSSTVTTGATVVPVDAAVVDFDEAGGQFLHQPTGDIYTYASADIDLETITLSAALPGGKTLTVDDALYVYPRADDYYADVAIDDVGTDVVAARVPQMLRAILEEGHGSGQVVRVEAGGEEWQVLELVGQPPELETGVFYTGDTKTTARVIAGGGVLIDGGWLKCDGTAVSRATYAALFNAIGTVWGAGNGTTTFNIPDARSRALFGAGTLVTLGATEGKAESLRGPGHVHAITNHGGHSHGINDTNHSGQSNTTAGGGADRVSTLNGSTTGVHAHGGNTVSGGSHDHGGDTGNSAGGGATDPFSYIGFNVLIKT
jgi:microcystin-dependent protein